MIAIDTSSFIAYLSGEKGSDVDAVELALEQKQVVLPPAVLTELLSDPKLPKSVSNLFRGIPLLPIEEGYWERVGYLRAQIIARGHKARLADAFIAQSCLDHHVSLITRDRDFRHFVSVAGLRIVS